MASRLTNDPLIGLHFGESLQLAALGVVGDIIKTSETVGQAISIAASLTPTITDLFTMKVEKSKKTYQIHLEKTSEKSSEFTERQLGDMLLVFTIHELNGFLLERINPEAVTYPYKITDRDEYERVFRCDKIKKANSYRMEFDNRFWDEPILTANRGLQKLFVDTLKSEQKGYVLNSQPFEQRVLNFLMQSSYLGVLSLEDVAANFNLSARSLQRKLQDEGTTFQQLSDAVKKSLAIQFMASGNYQIKEISSMLGYNEMSAFSRAFKRWTGKAPMNY